MIKTVKRSGSLIAILGWDAPSAVVACACAGRVGGAWRRCASPLGRRAFFACTCAVRRVKSEKAEAPTLQLLTAMATGSIDDAEWDVRCHILPSFTCF